MALSFYQYVHYCTNFNCFFKSLTLIKFKKIVYATCLYSVFKYTFDIHARNSFSANLYKEPDTQSNARSAKDYNVFTIHVNYKPGPTLLPAKEGNFKRRA